MNKQQYFPYLQLPRVQKKMLFPPKYAFSLNQRFFSKLRFLHIFRTVPKVLLILCFSALRWFGYSSAATLKETTGWLMAERCEYYFPSSILFGTFFIFPYIGNNHPNWLFFFRGVQTTLHCSAAMWLLKQPIQSLKPVWRRKNVSEF